MSEQHGLRALHTHFVRGLLQLVAAACTLGMTPALVRLSEGPVLPTVLFATCVLLTTLWLRACWAALGPVLELTSLSLELSVYRRPLVPALVAWGSTPLALQGVRRALASLGLALPPPVAWGALGLGSGTLVLSALAVLIINRYMWRQTHLDVTRGRALLDVYTRAGHTTGLERITTWLEWKEGRGERWPELLVRESYFPGIRLQPWHEASELEAVRDLERHVEEIRAEVLALAGDSSVLDVERTVNPDMHQWHSVYFHRRYQPVPGIRARAPRTVHWVDRLTGGASRDVMVSVLGPGGRIALHQDPDNLFLTCHLGILVPEGCHMHLAGETRGWHAGRCLVFNAAFEHHVWNDGPSTRIVLLVDFLHPDFTPLERRFLTEYFHRRGEPAAARPLPQAPLSAS